MPFGNQICLTSDAEIHVIQLFCMYVLQDESGYRWARDDHPTRPEYRYFLMLVVPCIGCEYLGHFTLLSKQLVEQDSEITGKGHLLK